MPSYICIAPVECCLCNGTHSVYVDFGKAYPSRRVQFECPEKGKDVVIMGYPGRAYTLISRLPKGAIVGTVLDDAK